MRRGCLASLCPALVAGFSLFASAAEARTFHLSPGGPDAWLVIDPRSAESMPGGVVRRMWTVMVQRSIVSGEAAQPGYVRTQSDYDCANREVRWRTFSAYSRSGDLLLTRNNAWPNWVPATSAPDIHTAFRVACEGGANSAVSAESIGQLVIALMTSWDPPTRPPAKRGDTAKPAPPRPATATSPAKAAPASPTPPAKKVP